MPLEGDFLRYYIKYPEHVSHVPSAIALRSAVSIDVDTLHTPLMHRVVPSNDILENPVSKRRDESKYTRTAALIMTPATAKRVRNMVWSTRRKGIRCTIMTT